MATVFPDIVKDCPKMRNLPKIFLTSFDNVGPSLFLLSLSLSLPDWSHGIITDCLEVFDNCNTSKCGRLGPSPAWLAFRHANKMFFWEMTNDCLPTGNVDAENSDPLHVQLSDLSTDHQRHQPKTDHRLLYLWQNHNWSMLLGRVVVKLSPLNPIMSRHCLWKLPRKKLLDQYLIMMKWLLRLWG